LSARFDPAGDLDKSLWDRVIAINLTAPAMVTKQAVNLFLKHDVKGAIVNIASVAGAHGFISGLWARMRSPWAVCADQCFDRRCVCHDLGRRCPR